MNTLTIAIPTIRGVPVFMQIFDEQQALDGLKNLDSQIIGAVYDEYFPEVYRYVRYRLNDEQAAEDIASDRESWLSSPVKSRGKMHPSLQSLQRLQRDGMLV